MLLLLREIAGALKEQSLVRQRFLLSESNKFAACSNSL